MGRSEETQGTASASSVPPMRSREAMEGAIGMGTSEFIAAYVVQGVAGWPGSQTRELVAQAHGHVKATTAALATASAAAPDEASAEVLRSWSGSWWMMFARPHALPDFVPEAAFGVGGALLRESIEVYDFDRHHSVAKGFLFFNDWFTFGAEPLGLLLFFGDLATACAGLAKVVDANRRVLGRVQSGVASADAYVYEMLPFGQVFIGALLSLGKLEMLRELMAHSLLGRVLEDEAARNALASAWTGPYGWTTDDGHRNSSLETCLLFVRCVLALLNEGDAAATLQAWLPLPAALLRIAEFDCAWRGFAVGASHPALLGARLHGERLGQWGATAEVAEGVLQIEEFHPLLRTEAWRLLGRARAELGERAAACEAAERAVAEAAKARYMFLELQSLRDLLRWSEAAEAEGVRARLSGVAGRMAATAEEVAGVLGEGVLP